MILYDWREPHVLWPKNIGAKEPRAGVYVLESRRKEILEELLKLGMLTGKALEEAKG